MIMEGSTVPLRYHHNTHLGVVRLPKRYNVNQNGSDEQEYLSDSLDDRLRDMTQAITWIKQEMVFLRQHDVLLKRQFLDIHDTILSLQKVKSKYNGHTRIYRKCSHPKASSNSSLYSNASSIDITLENYSVRSASSATVLNESESSDTDDQSYRPRTSSMKTTRDLAALARRRGSKELI